MRLNLNNIFAPSPASPSVKTQKAQGRWGWGLVLCCCRRRQCFKAIFFASLIWLSLRSCFCVHAGCQAYFEIRWGKKSRCSSALYKQRCRRSSLDFLHPVGIFSSTGYLSSSLLSSRCMPERSHHRVSSILSFFELRL